jgi:hypothetical protein
MSTWKVTFSVSASHLSKGVATGTVLVPTNTVEIEAETPNDAINIVAGYFNCSSVDVNVPPFPGVRPA